MPRRMRASHHGGFTICYERVAPSEGCTECERLELCLAEAGLGCWNQRHASGSGERSHHLRTPSQAVTIVGSELFQHTPKLAQSRDDRRRVWPRSTTR